MHDGGGPVAARALWRDGARLYRRHLTPFLQLALILAVPLHLVGAGVGYLVAGMVGSEAFWGYAGALAAAPFGYLGRELLAAGVVCALVDVDAGLDVGLSRIGRRLRRRALPALGVALLADVLTALGLLVLVVPGVIASLSWAWVTQVVVFEDATPWRALARSRRLTSGHRGALAALSLGLTCIDLLLTAGARTALPQAVLDVPGFGAIPADLVSLVLMPLGPCVITTAFLRLRSATGPAAARAPPA